MSYAVSVHRMIPVSTSVADACDRCLCVSSHMFYNWTLTLLTVARVKVDKSAKLARLFMLRAVLRFSFGEQSVLILCPDFSITLTFLSPFILENSEYNSKMVLFYQCCVNGKRISSLCPCVYSTCGCRAYEARHWHWNTLLSHSSLCFTTRSLTTPGVHCFV